MWCLMSLRCIFSFFVTQEQKVVTSSEIKHAYLSSMKDFRCVFTEILLPKLTEDIAAFVAAYIKAKRGASSGKKKRRTRSSYRDGVGAGCEIADEEEYDAEVDDQSTDDLQALALGEIVSVLKLPSSFLDRDGNEITFAECTVSAFASYVTNHLLTSGKDMDAHGIDIHDNLAYFQDFDENTRQTIQYVPVAAALIYLLCPPIFFPAFSAFMSDFFSLLHMFMMSFLSCSLCPFHTGLLVTRGYTHSNACSRGLALSTLL